MYVFRSMCGTTMQLKCTVQSLQNRKFGTDFFEMFRRYFGYFLKILLILFTHVGYRNINVH